MKTNLKLFFGILILLMICNFSFSQTNINNNLNGKSFFTQQFLTIPIEPRSSGMGFTKICTEPNVYNAYYNPSILPFTYNTLGSLNVNYLPWSGSSAIEGIYYLSFAGFQKLNSKQMVAANIRFYNFGQLNLISESFEELGLVSPFNMSSDISFASKLNYNWSLGMTLRYILNFITSKVAYNNNIDIIKSHSFAADLSASYLKNLKNHDAIYLGFTLSNLGTSYGVRYNYDYKPYLPANLGVGFSYNKFLNKLNLISFSLDLNKLLVPILYYNNVTKKYSEEFKDGNVLQSYVNSFIDNRDGIVGELLEISLGTGVEWWYDDRVALRCGYFNDSKNVSNNKILTFGLGFKFASQLEFDMSYNANLSNEAQLSGTPYNNSLRFGIIYNRNGNHFDDRKAGIKCISPR